MANKVKVHLRKRFSLFTNNDCDWTYLDRYYDPKKIAVLVIGLWDSHNCQVAANILDELSPKADVFLKKCRTNGSHIIFGSSSLTKNPEYKQLGKNIRVPFQNFKDYGITIPPLPFDDSDGGIVANNPNFNREDVNMHPAIEISNNDCMSGNSKEIMNYLVYNHVELLLVVGVHLNMCVLDRPYAIKNLIRYGMKVALVKDLTDIMYSGKLESLTREEMTNRMIEWVEEYVCPTTTTDDVCYLNGREVYYVDVDNTVCHGDTYETSEPDQEIIDKVNSLYESGKYVIIYWTARGSVGNKDWKKYTQNQLLSWGAKFHGVQINKAWFDRLVDDKNLTIDEFKELNLG